MGCIRQHMFWGPLLCQPTNVPGWISIGLAQIPALQATAPGIWKKIDSEYFWMSQARLVVPCPRRNFPCICACSGHVPCNSLDLPRRIERLNPQSVWQVLLNKDFSSQPVCWKDAVVFFLHLPWALRLCFDRQIFILYAAAFDLRHGRPAVCQQPDASSVSKQLLRVMSAGLIWNLIHFERWWFSQTCNADRHTCENRPNEFARGSRSTTQGSSCFSKHLVLLSIRGAIIVMATRGKRKSIGGSGNSQKQLKVTEPVVCPITAQLTEWFRGNALCQSFILPCFKWIFQRLAGLVCLQMAP